MKHTVLATLLAASLAVTSAAPVTAADMTPSESGGDSLVGAVLLGLLFTLVVTSAGGSTSVSTMGEGDGVDREKGKLLMEF